MVNRTLSEEALSQEILFFGNAQNNHESKSKGVQNVITLLTLMTKIKSYFQCAFFVEVLFDLFSLHSRDYRFIK